MTIPQVLDAPVKLRTLPHQVAAVVLQRIAAGRLTEDSAPSEARIAGEFGVSRVVAREALKILAGLEVVRIAQGRGVTIRPDAKWDYLNPLLAQWLPEQQLSTLLPEVHQMRLLLEPELAAMAAGNIGKDALTQLHAIVQGMPAAESDPDQYLAIDHDFHMRICHAANNRILDRIMYASRGLTTASRHITNTGSLRHATAAHTHIYDAIAAHDTDAAHEAMRAHLHGSRPILEKNRRMPTRRRTTNTRK